METILCNLGESRRETLNGREYLVAPATLIVGDTVLPGSDGPGLYLAEDVTANVEAWNNMPIVVRHPTDERGRPISARTPKVLNEWGIGNIWHNRAEGGNLVAEAYFDIAAVKRVDQKLVKNGSKPLWPHLDAKLPIELSTGLKPRKQFTPGITANGVSYEWIARQPHDPDHLALFPPGEERGACSIIDGCGVNNQADDKRTLWQRLGAALGIVNESALPSSAIHPAKACQVLKDGAANGEPLTDDQKGMFGAACGDVQNAWTEGDAEMAIQNARMCWGKPCDGGDEVQKAAVESDKNVAKQMSEKAVAASQKANDSGTAEDHAAALDAHRTAFTLTRSGSKARAVHAAGINHHLKHTTNQGENDMPLTPAQRQAAIKDLTTNCKCKIKPETLNALADDELTEVHNSAKLTLVVNAYRAGKLGGTTNADGEGEAVPGVPWPQLAKTFGIDVDPRQDPVGFTAAMKKALDMASGKLGGASPPAPDAPVTAAEADPMEPDQDDQMTDKPIGNRDRRKRVINEADLPANIREDLSYARDMRQKEKMRIVNRLISNVSDETRRNAIGNKLMKETVEQLQERLDMTAELIGNQVEAPKQPDRFDFSLAAGGFGVVNAEDDAAQDDVVRLMTANCGVGQQPQKQTA